MEVCLCCCCFCLYVADVVPTVISLDTKNARELWEKEFNFHYMQPVLSKLDARLHDSYDLIAKDDKQGHFCPDVHNYIVV